MIAELIFGKLTLDAIPFDTPIIMAGGLFMAIVFFGAIGANSVTLVSTTGTAGCGGQTSCTVTGVTDSATGGAAGNTTPVSLVVTNQVGVFG